MKLIILIIFYFSAFIIFWAMIGYPISLRLLKRVYKNKNLEKDFSYEPTVTIMIVAHNEEKVILEKLENVLKLNYPKEKVEVLIASDNSTDDTNSIVNNFISNHREENIRLFEVQKRKGKTNAQNEAQKTVNSEILVMTDANSMLDRNSINELVSSFTSSDISYVSGRLAFLNKEISSISNTENTYWDADTKLRKIESDIQTITAGNGALYACRNNDYHDFKPIKSHDANMPRHYALKGKKALYNPHAVAYEKAGENIEDEFKRKVRMNRGILTSILPDFRILNIFKYRWYSYFYFGHRTCRYLLWLSHLLILVSNAIIVADHWVYLFTFIGQLIFYILALVKLLTGSNNKILTLIYYYCVTIIAQWVGVFNILTGKTKPFWEKAESTR